MEGRRKARKAAVEKLAKKAKDPVRATLEAIANKLAHTRICSASVTSPSSQGDRTEYAQCEGVRRRGIQGKTKRGSGEAVECSPGDDRTLSSSIFPNSFLFICRRRTPTTPAPASPSTLWCGPIIHQHTSIFVLKCCFYEGLIVVDRMEMGPTCARRQSRASAR